MERDDAVGYTPASGCSGLARAMHVASLRRS